MAVTDVKSIYPNCKIEDNRITINPAKLCIVNIKIKENNAEKGKPVVVLRTKEPLDYHIRLALPSLYNSNKTKDFIRESIKNYISHNQIADYEIICADEDIEDLGSNIYDSIVKIINKGDWNCKL